MLKKFLDIIKTQNSNIKHIKESGIEKSDIGNINFKHAELTECHGSARAYVAARAFQESSVSMIAIFPTHKDATRFMDDLVFFMPQMQSSILYFPGYHENAF
ncbi:MAG: hypothetical protein HQK61_09675 [Desulfamplus sp.]|nr:hypothetical protein [Desulfamplus sp.]